MKGFDPGLMNKLMGFADHKVTTGAIARFSVDELKDSVARDLESLLNTRSVLQDSLLKIFPECARSILTYGLQDFASLSLASADDRYALCCSLEQSIACHEPRLRNVRVALELQQRSINCLSFSITALLMVNFAKEPVNFDAVLQPSSLQYAVTKSRPLARIGV